MRPLPILLALLLVTFAGCTGTEGDTEALDSGPAADGAPQAEQPAAGDAMAANGTEASLETVPVAFEGNLGTYGFACHLGTVGCHGTSVTGTDSSMDHGQSGASLVGVQLVLEWSAPTPATERLGLRIHHGDGFRHFVEGASPLALDLADLDLPLDEDDLHVSVYNAQGIVNQPPFYAYVSVDQEFTLAGSLTLRSDA